MDQLELNNIHASVMVQIEHYASGLLTIVELQNMISKLDLSETTGLIDPASGLRIR